MAAGQLEVIEKLPLYKRNEDVPPGEMPGGFLLGDK